MPQRPVRSSHRARTRLALAHRDTERTLEMLNGRRFSPAMIVAMIALAVALSGTAVAGTAKLITGSQIANGAIKLAHLNPSAKTALKGQRGAQGPAGTHGPAGEQGVTGAKGDPGPKGATCDRAKGEPGSQGPAGERGPQGETGLQGERGPKGDTGVSVGREAITNGPANIGDSPTTLVSLPVPAGSFAVSATAELTNVTNRRVQVQCQLVADAESDAARAEVSPYDEGPGRLVLQLQLLHTYMSPGTVELRCADGARTNGLRHSDQRSCDHGSREDG